MAALGGPPKLTLNLDALEGAPGLSRRRGLSVTGPADDHAGSPAKRGPGAGLFSFGGANGADAGQPKPLFGSTAAAGTSATGATSPGAFGSAPSGILGGSIPPASTAGGTSTAGGAFGGGGASFSFPAKPATSTPFGGAAPAPAAGSSTGGLFGSGSGTAASAPQQSGGLFGSTPAAPAASGGAFGSSTAAPASSGALFGSTPAATGTGTGAFGSGGGAFGSTGTGTGAFGTGGGGAFGSGGTGAFGSGGGAFGASTSGAGTSGTLFGSSSTSAFGQPAAAPTTNAFGQSTASTAFGTSSFGQSQQQPSNALVPFGQSQQQQRQPFGGSLLGTPTRSLAASTAAGRAQKPEVPIAERLLQLKNAWDKGNPACRFQYFFYNIVPPEQVPLYARPPLAQNDSTWSLALRSNPQPDRMVPVLAVGFSDLRRRAAAQEGQAQAHLARLEEVGAVLTRVSRKANLETAARLDKLRTQQTHLSSRLTHLVAQLHPLTPLAKSSIRPEEELLARRLQELKSQIEGSGVKGGKGGKARLGELWGLVGQRKASLAEGGREEGGWAVIDEAELAKVLDVLSQQQAGLDHLVRTLRRMTGELDVMRSAFGLPTARPRGEQDL